WTAPGWMGSGRGTGVLSAGLGPGPERAGEVVEDDGRAGAECCDAQRAADEGARPESGAPGVPKVVAVDGLDLRAGHQGYLRAGPVLVRDIAIQQAESDGDAREAKGGQPCGEARVG